MLKKIKIKIKGTHCQSCKTLIETEVDILKGVKDITVDHVTGKTEIEFDDNQISQRKIFAKIEKLKYKVEKIKKTKAQVNKKKKMLIASGLFILLIIVYVLIKNSGALELLAKLNEAKISYWLIFLIGILVSFHCVGMCGGLVVAYTARHHAKGDKQTKASWPHIQYNLGRTISYTMVGGILGGLGSFFAINPTFTGSVILIAGIFMILMGLSFITSMSWFEKIKLKMPSFMGKFLYSQRHTRKPKGPFIIGLLNGLMPCGPLQAMQIYALASGSIVRGALSMGIYALGTVPLMFGFGNFISLISKDKIKQVMKISGIVVIILGLFMINRGLTNFGYGFREFVPRESSAQTEFIVTGDVKEYQTVNMAIKYRGYDPNVIYIKKGVPVRWIITAKEMTRCTDEIILHDGYNIRKKLKQGKNIIEFTPTKVGEIKFSCWMQMVWGKFIVTDENKQPSRETIYKESLNLPEGSCGGTTGSSGSCGGDCGIPSCGCGSIIRAY
ncbi:sulfite exporter TauE/SafE family protein [Patescibacteria group bacterium]|nr:sulfite exporter TauE/SafE family protein [Patescibacteria group bacterium]